MIDVGELGPLWLLVAILTATLAAAVATGRSTVPASVVLVVVGLVIALAGPDVGLPVPPSVLLAVVLPGLVFEAAFRTDPAVLRPVLVPVVVLAVPGVLIVAAIVGFVLSAMTSLSPTEGFLVGAMVAATDPAAVLSTFRRVAVPARLATLVEMESLVNDGTGIVLFGLALELLEGGGSIGGSILAFAVRVAGAAVLGAGLGWLAARLVHRVHDHLAELTLTVVLAYGTYLVAEALGLSAVIATLVAASAFGALARGGLSARARDAIDVVWDFAAFLLTAGVFLLVGLSIAPETLVHAAGAIGLGILGVLVSRLVVVYGLLGAVPALIGRLSGRRLGAARSREPAVLRVPRAWLPVIFWAGLRGAVSVALALSVPADLANRELIQGVTFGIVLFTLIVQGATAERVVRRSGATSAA